MNSRHLDPALTVRPKREVKDAAKAVLDEHHRDMTAFITACLAAVAAEPDKMLKLLAKHWPPPKPKGRPKRTDSGD